MLGTNNTADPADAARLAGWVDLVDSLRSPEVRQKVYWVTPHRPPSYVGSKSRWTLDDFNTELRRLDDEHRWLRVIDFDLVAKAHPEWFEQDTAMHLHPDAAGQGVLVALIAGPDAAPVEIPAPLFTGPPTPSAEPAPQTFVNPPRRASASPAPTTPTPAPTRHVSARAGCARQTAAASPAPVPATSGEASPASSG